MTAMRRFNILALLAWFGFTGLSFADVKVYEVEAFSKLDVSSGITVIFTASGERSVLVRHVEDDFDGLDVIVRNQTLILRRNKKLSLWDRHFPYQIEVSGQVLSGLVARGEADITGQGMRGPHLHIDLSDGAYAELSDLQGQEVHLSVASGADLTLSGDCDQLHASAASCSYIEARSLSCDSASVAASGNSAIIVYANSELAAKASQSSDITVHGRPQSVQTEETSRASVDFAR